MQSDTYSGNAGISKGIDALANELNAQGEGWRPDRSDLADEPINADCTTRGFVNDFYQCQDYRGECNYAEPFGSSYLCKSQHRRRYSQPNPLRQIYPLREKISAERIHENTGVAQLALNPDVSGKKKGRVKAAAVKSRAVETADKGQMAVAWLIALFLPH